MKNERILWLAIVLGLIVWQVAGQQEQSTIGYTLGPVPKATGIAIYPWRIGEGMIDGSLKSTTERLLLIRTWSDGETEYGHLGLVFDANCGGLNDPCFSGWQLIEP